MKDIKYAEWKIEAVDDKLSEGKYIEDSQEADAHIFKNLQVVSEVSSKTLYHPLN